MERIRLMDRVRAAVRVRHYSLKTTQIYSHVLNRGGPAVRSPLSRLATPGIGTDCGKE